MRKLPAILAILLLFGVSTHAAPNPQKPSQRTPVNSAAETEQWEAMKKRFALHQSHLTGSMWGLIHGYRSKAELDQAMNLFQRILDAMAKNSPSQLRSIGGVEGFLNRFLEIMRSQRDDVVAGFAAKVLAVFGGTRYAPDIARILKGRDKSWTDETVYPEPTVRGQAAVALSIIQATQYKSDIAVLLRSMNTYDRSGALHALAALKATEYAGEIAALLSNKFGFRRHESVIYALINLGVGGQYTKEIAQALDDDFSPEAREAAIYGLAHLQAAEYAPQIAKLLDARYQRGDAAKGLAILGAKKYAGKIAALLEDEGAPLDQAAALIALGILETNEYAPKAAQLMRDKQKSFVSVYAAQSLILMGNNDYLEEAATHFTVANVEKYPGFGDLHPLVEEEAGQIHQKFLTKLKQLKGQR